MGFGKGPFPKIPKAETAIALIEPGRPTNPQNPLAQTHAPAYIFN